MPANPPEMIYLVGTSGHPNYEDEFVTAAWFKHLAAARPDAEVWLECPNPGQASHLYSELHPRVRFTDSLYRLVWETRDMSPEEAGEHIRHRMHHLGTPRFDLGLLAPRRASTVHVLGGGYINAHWPFHVGLLQAVAALKDVAETEMALVATGLGLTPVAREGSLVAALKAFDHVSVRDVPSAEITGAGLAPDDAFLGVRELPGYAAEPAQAQDGEVWVNVQHDMAAPEAFDAAVQATREALVRPEMQGRAFHYLEAIPGVDRIAYDRLSDLIPAENFLSFGRLWHSGFPARAGQTWFTTRFQIHLLAAACGAAGSAIEINDEYDRVKHQSLLDLGTGWSLTPVGSGTVAEPAVSKGFPYKCRTLSQDKIGEARRVYPPRPKAEDPSPVQSPATQRKRGGWLSRW